MYLYLCFKDSSPPCSSSPSLRNHRFSEKLGALNYAFFSHLDFGGKFPREIWNLTKCIVPVGKWRGWSLCVPLQLNFWKEKQASTKTGEQPVWLIIAGWDIFFKCGKTTGHLSSSPTDTVVGMFDPNLRLKNGQTPLTHAHLEMLHNWFQPDKRGRLGGRQRGVLGTNNADFIIA